MVWNVLWCKILQNIVEKNDNEIDDLQMLDLREFVLFLEFNSPQSLQGSFHS